MNTMNRILNSFRHVLAGLALIALIGVAGTNAAIARDASGKGSPEYGAGKTTPHGIKPGQGISGKPEDHGNGTAHVPGASGGHEGGKGKGGSGGSSGGHDDEGHGEEGDDSSHEGGTGHVPGGEEDESGHDEGEEHDEGHEPGPKKGGGGH